MDGYNKFQRLTPTERSFVLRHPLAAMTFNDDATKALAEAQRRYPRESLHNGDGDAFRHAYWNALMTRHESEDLAREFADAHESAPGQPEAERRMDLHNNAVGRQIGKDNPTATDEQLADRAAQALTDGKLIKLK